MPGLGHNHFIIFWKFINGDRYKNIAESVEKLASGTGKKGETKKEEKASADCSKKKHACLLLAGDNGFACVLVVYINALQY